MGISEVRQMKNSGISWVGEIPQDWEIQRNKYIFKIKKGIVLPTKSYQLLSLTTNGIKEKDEDDTSGKVPENYDGYQIVRKHDLVMCLFDLDCSAVFSGLSYYDGMISPAYKILKIDNSVSDERYYAYWFNYVSSKRYYKQYSKSLRYTLNADEFNRLFSPVPPLEEQQCIADFLDRECERIDKLKADIQAQIDSLEEYKKSVITEAVTHGLNPSAPMKDSGIIWIGQIPSNWAIGRIGGLYELRKQKVSDKEYMPLSVTMKGILPQLDTVAKTNDGDNRKLVRKGDFAINSRSDRRGSCGISNYDGSVSLINTILKPRNIMNANYYNWLFHTPIFADEFYKWGHGIVDDLWTTNWQEMKRITIPVPPLDEQKAIAEYIDHKCAEIEQIIADRKTQFETLDDYKQSLIYEYVTGKKEVPINEL